MNKISEVYDTFAGHIEVIGVLANRVISSISLGALLGHFLAGLPPVALILTIIWYAMVIYEKFTGRKIADRRKKRRE